MLYTFKIKHRISSYKIEFDTDCETNPKEEE